MSPASSQLVLPISANPDATWSHWVSRPETEQLERFLQDDQALQPPGVFIWGDSGLGKSHLLQAKCAEMRGAAVYLPMAIVMDAAPDELLEGIEASAALLIDDVHLALTNSAWQEGLFHCFNRCVASGTPLIISSQKSTSSLSDLLPDLQSRFALLAGFKLPSWQMASFESLLYALGKQRGLILRSEVIRYLTLRLRHTPSAALDAIQRIERSSLVEQRSPTVPFLKTIGL